MVFNRLQILFGLTIYTIGHSVKLLIGDFYYNKSIKLSPMFELAIGIILGVALFQILKSVWKAARHLDLEELEYENQN